MAAPIRVRDRGHGVPPERGGLDQPVQRVRAAGAGRPIGVATAIVALLAIVVWQPWGRGAPAAADHGSPAIAAATGVSALPSPSAGPSAGPGASPGGPGRPGEAVAARSLLDDDWTIVAVLAPDALASADEPWEADRLGVVRAPAVPLLVQQNQLGYTEAPLERPGRPDVACTTPSLFREASAAHLPVGQVKYLGVTFPGMSPKARVTAAVLGVTGIRIQRLPLLVVPPAGGPGDPSYVVPDSGVGAAVFFGRVLSGIGTGGIGSAGTWPSGTYRFEVRSPDFADARFMYACIGS